uniref:Uncharacterized protein n=1 Tax=Utricularia reniformis TaxID=192314 RepID=A0A1Y0B4J5_9LAMI|nr:hypothetical protein AEK19_MT2229 [Utricularia reniformis]ART32375.1 hypothetical protein AEK19_MT2229 [Utricularia reniformis]
MDCAFQYIGRPPHLLSAPMFIRNAIPNLNDSSSSLVRYHVRMNIGASHPKTMKLLPIDPVIIQNHMLRLQNEIRFLENWHRALEEQKEIIVRAATLGDRGESRRTLFILVGFNSISVCRRLFSCLVFFVFF